MARIDAVADHPIRFELRPDERYTALSQPREDLRVLLPRHLTVMAAALSEVVYPHVLLWLVSRP